MAASGLQRFLARDGDPDAGGLAAAAMTVHALLANLVWADLIGHATMAPPRALMRLSLPDGSGLDLLREQRARGARTPVILVTARDQISDRIARLDAGADDHMVKPFDLAEISARIRANARCGEGRPPSSRWADTASTAPAPRCG